MFMSVSMRDGGEVPMVYLTLLIWNNNSIRYCCYSLNLIYGKKGVGQKHVPAQNFT